MNLFDRLALVVIVLTAVYFFVLGTVSLVRPERAKGFVLGFASSSRTHYLELAIRTVVGVALVRYAPHFVKPLILTIIGGVLLCTTAILLLVPWRWHQAFARRTVPHTLKYLSWIGVASIVFGGLLLAGLIF